MKRADLRVGQEYLVCEQNDWETFGRAIRRVEVVDLGHWQESSFLANQGGEMIILGKRRVMTAARRTPGVGGILVVDKDVRGGYVGGDQPIRTYAIHPAHLRAGWVDGAKLIAAARKNRRAHEQERQAIRSDAEYRISKLPVKDVSLVLPVTKKTTVRVPLAELEALVEKAQRAEKYLDWLISMDDPDPSSPCNQDRRRVTLTQIINRAAEVKDVPEELAG